MSESKLNFYEILNATSTATLNQLKSNYKQLILQCHPDKMQQQQQVKKEKNNLQQIQDDDPIISEFVAITEAWNCLKDPIKRKQYDAELLLKKFHTHNNIYAHIKLNEMKKQPNTGDYYEEEEGDKLVLREKENEQQEEKTKYIYTYDCRCGGQYIVDDESAEEYCRYANNRDIQINNSNNNNGGVVVDDDNDDDDADSTAENKKSSSPNNMNYKENNGGASGAGGSEGVVQNNTDDDDDDVDEEGGGDLIVECSECSLVIILNG